MNCWFNDSMDRYLVLSHLNIHTFVDEWWTPSGKRGSSYGKICMFSWWVFVLSQKAVWMLFEDWLECRACSSASLESLPYEFFSAAAALHVQWFQWRIACGLFYAVFVSCCFPRLHTLWSSWRDENKLFRSELKASHQTFSRSLLWVLVQKNPFGWILRTLLQIKHGPPWCITLYCS